MNAWAKNKNDNNTNSEALVSTGKSTDESKLSEEPTFTIDDAIEHFGFGPFQFAISIFAGVSWMAEAMEMMIMSILASSLNCEWHIGSKGEALVTSCVFVGMVFSSLVWGYVCDHYGRRIGIMLISLTTFAFGMGSAFAPNFTVFIIIRTLMGFGIGGIPQSVTYYSEFLPVKNRAFCVICMQIFWAIGGGLESLLALFVMQYANWRFLIGFSTVPMLISAFTCLFVPESARYSITNGRLEEARRTLETIARMNGKAMPLGRLVEATKAKEGEEKARVTDLFNRELLLTTLLIMPIWFISSFNYYGTVLYTTVLYTSGDPCHGYTASPPAAADVILAALGNVTNTLVGATNVPKFTSAADAVNQAAAFLDDKGALEQLCDAATNWNETAALSVMWDSVPKWAYNATNTTLNAAVGALTTTSAGGQLTLTNFEVTSMLATWTSTLAAFANNASVIAVPEDAIKALDTDCKHRCQVLTNSDYLDFVQNSFAEIPGLLTASLLLQFWGRRRALVFQFFVYTVAISVLHLCLHRWAVVALLSIGRSIISGAFQTAYVYTPEVYPTSLRAFAMGLASGSARAGSTITPFVAHYLSEWGLTLPAIVYGTMSALAAFCSFLLPIETRGRPMMDRMAQMTDDTDLTKKKLSTTST